MNELVSALKAELERRPGLTVTEIPGGLDLTPAAPDGFLIRCFVDPDGGCHVAFEGWHKEFESVDEALKCVRFGLSAKWRLKVQARGGLDHKWTVQYQNQAEWTDDSTTGLLLFPFWRRTRIRYLQNRVL